MTVQERLTHRLCLWQEPRDYLVDRIITLENLLVNAESKVAELTAELSALNERICDSGEIIGQYEKIDKIARLETQLSEKNYLLTGYEYTIQQQGFEIERLKMQLSRDREAINHICKTENK